MTVETKLTNPQGVTINPEHTPATVLRGYVAHLQHASTAHSASLDVYMAQRGVRAAVRFHVYAALRHALFGTREGGPLSKWLETATDAQLIGACTTAAELSE